MDKNDIIKVVTSEYMLDDLFKKTRIAIYVEARAVFFWILKNGGWMSCSAIGKEFGFSHATIIHHVNRVDGQMQFDKSFKRKVENILQKVCLD